MKPEFNMVRPQRLNEDEQFRALNAAIIIQAYKDVEKWCDQYRKGKFNASGYTKGFYIFLDALRFFESEKLDEICGVLDINPTSVFETVNRRFGDTIREIMAEWKGGAEYV